MTIIQVLLMEDKTLRLWDSNTGAQIGDPLEGHDDLVYSVAFSPNGARIVSGSDDRTVRIWDTTGIQIGDPLVGHDDSIRAVAFSPDGTRILSGSRDKTIRIWDVTTGGQICDPHEGHYHSVSSVAFSPDGTRIVSGSHDKTLRIWNATVTVEFKVLCFQVRGIFAACKRYKNPHKILNSSSSSTLIFEDPPPFINMFKFSTSILFSTVLLATSMGAYSSLCNPNAQGEAVSIASASDDGLEWGLLDNVIGSSGSAAPNWYLQPNGSYYYIQDITSGLVATVTGTDILLNNEQSALQSWQLFNVSCETCSTNAIPGDILAEGCVIRPASAESTCASMDTTLGDPVLIESCSPLADSNIFALIF
ncbi:WD40 repeat-like protein [Gymnopus androsaceus JB14]|uniref:WD40 repeat-like protein n=1 Tax=Gymnopus androsaceus JB14 TaxID=1447944 RepID=A0A6A4GW70_9AGAR|nr:WD40 repeat-like protein [Gymnopus androsaceus JB14]